MNEIHPVPALMEHRISNNVSCSVNTVKRNTLGGVEHKVGALTLWGGGKGLVSGMLLIRRDV